jgi:hypothetical protein
MKKLLTFSVWTGLIWGCISSHAGVLLTKSNQAEVGNLLESETSISLQSQFGAVDFKKDNLLWYSIDKDVDSFLKGARKAQSDGNTEASLHLYGLSVSKEPATKMQAQQELQVLELSTKKVPNTNAIPSPDAPPVTAEDKIKRGEQMVQNGKYLQSQTFIDKRVQAENKKLADKNVAEGQKLIDEGKKELEAVKAQQVAEAAVAQQVAEQKKEEEKKVEVAKQERQELLKPIEWTDTEVYVNYGTAAVLILAVFFAFWQITMKEPKR